MNFPFIRISAYKNQAGLTEASLGYSLHLHDCRGTATTKLLEAGASASQLATVFGWKLKYATQMIEVYAVVGSDKTDKILELYAEAEKNVPERNCKMPCKMAPCKSKPRGLSA